MDPWDRNVENTFDSFFDRNGDGVLDPIEQAFELDYITRQLNEDEGFNTIENDLDPDDFDDDF